MGDSMEGKVAIVTGASSGIGRAAAIAFGRAGCSVTVAARRVEESEETVNLVNNAGGKAIFVQTDVSSGEQVKRLVDTTVHTFGGVDYAFNNAANMEPRAGGEWHDVAEEDWDSQVDVGLKGVWLSMKYELPAMLERGGGAIVNNSSIAALFGGGAGPYTAVKHGIVGLTRSASVRYAGRGIRINAVCPGIIDTQIWQRRYQGDQAFESELKSMQPMNRLGSAAEVADAVTWLCSAGSAFVTGQYIVVDGGLMSRGAAPSVTKA